MLLTGLLEGSKIEESIEKVKETCVPLILSGLKLWVPVHMVTYGIIPQPNRLLWVDGVEIIWVIILATQANKELEAKDKALKN